MNNQSVAGLGPFNIERTREWVISLDERKRIAGFLQRVAETV